MGFTTTDTLMCSQKPVCGFLAHFQAQQNGATSFCIAFPLFDFDARKNPCRSAAHVTLLLANKQGDVQ